MRQFTLNQVCRQFRTVPWPWPPCWQNVFKRLTIARLFVLQFSRGEVQHTYTPITIVILKTMEVLQTLARPELG